MTAKNFYSEPCYCIEDKERKQIICNVFGLTEIQNNGIPYAHLYKLEKRGNTLSIGGIPLEEGDFNIRLVIGATEINEDKLEYLKTAEDDWNNFKIIAKL